MIDDDPRIDPSDLRKARFPGSFRRYDAKAVEEFLESVAERVDATNALVDELRTELDEARAAAQAEPAPGEASPFDAPDLTLVDEEELVRLVGEETAHVLSTARKASSDIRTKAEEAAARIIREATAEAARATEEAEAKVVELLAEASSVRDTAVEDAEAQAAEVRERAEAEVEQLLNDAREQAEAERATAEGIREQAEADAAQILEDARAEGRSMLDEAKGVRTRVLEDLQRRRDLGRAQVEKLVAGRAAILEAYAAVRANVDEITSQLEDGLLEGPADPVLDEGFVGVVSTVGSEAHDDLEALEAELAGPPADEGDAADADDTPAESDVVPADVEVAEDAPADAGAPTDEPADDEPADDETVADASDEPRAADDTDDDIEDDAGDAAAEPAGGGEVDALFHRIRSDRAESVARAQKVLAEDLDDAPADAAADTTGDDEAGDRDADATADAEVDPELLADSEALSRRSETIEALDKALARALKRHLADEQNVVLDALRQSQTTDPAVLLPPRDDHVEGYALAASVHLTTAAEAGAATVEAGVPVDVTELALALGGTLIDPFRRRIERSAGEVDGDADALDERLRALYREWKVEHIASATTDALLSAYAIGQHAAAASGATLRWRIDPTQGPCPDAQDNALAGAVPKGEAFPTGDECPQAHPGCRCLLVVES